MAHVAHRPPANSSSMTSSSLSARRTMRTYRCVPPSMILLTPLKNRPGPLPPSCLSSSSADSAGVNVTALNTESTTENAIVSENC